MSKLLSLIVAATFAVVAVPSFAASHTGAAMDKGDKMEKDGKKKPAKKKAAKKADKKMEDKK